MKYAILTKPPIFALFALILWAVFIAISTGVYAGFVFPALSFFLLGLGRGFLFLFPRWREANGVSLLLSMPVGFVIAAAASQLLLHKEQTQTLVFFSLLPLALAGLFLFLKQLLTMKKETIPKAWAFLAMGLFVLLVYYLPLALTQARPDESGQLSWHHHDALFLEAITATLSEGSSPPKAPGYATENLSYHYGAYALGAVFANVFDIHTSDMHHRVLKGLGLLSLLLAAFAFGLRLKLLDIAAEKRALYAAGGLFLLGGVVHWFALIPTFFRPGSETLVEQLMRLFFKPAIRNGCWYDFMLAHSGLWGSVALVSILTILLVDFKEEKAIGKRFSPAYLFPALMIATGIFPALAGLGLLLGVSVFFAWRNLHLWWKLLIAIGGFFLLINLYEMGSVGSDEAMWDFPDFTHALPFLFNWAFFYLGVRLLYFEAIARGESRPVKVLLILGLLGHIGIYLLFWSSLTSGHIYGHKYATTLISIVAGILVFHYLECLLKRETSEAFEAFKRLLGIAAKVAAGLSAAMILAFPLVYFMQGMSKKLLLGMIGTLGFAGFCFLLLKLLKHFEMKRWMEKVGGWAFGFVALSSAFAWVTAMLLIGVWQSVFPLVHLSQAEAKDLAFLSETLEPNLLVATNKNRNEQTDDWRQSPTSYSYTALSRRDVLLEGVFDHFLQWDGYNALDKDNETLFNTPSEVKALEIIDKYGIGVIVAKPGTKPKFLENGTPDWLTPIQGLDTLKAWEVSH